MSEARVPDHSENIANNLMGRAGPKRSNLFASDSPGRCRLATKRSNGDQRLCLCAEVGNDNGLLYFYDPTGNEYAVVDTEVPLAAVENAFSHAQRLGDHLAAEDFVAHPPAVPTVRPSLGTEQ